MLRSFVLSKIITTNAVDYEVIPTDCHLTEGVSIKNLGTGNITVMCNALYDGEGTIPSGEVLHIYGDVSFRITSLKIKESGSSFWVSCGLSNK